ncbi:MAG: DUF4976 domain-containing protein [Candidatus Poribacteria bacterium]|nr:DUF4976 domain-containing protein [Candidatus Poribacteria bacterium]
MAPRRLLEDVNADWDRVAMTTHGRGNHAVRTRRWRYISYADGSEELYDHAADPMEWKNVAGDSQYSSVKTRLAKSMPTEAESAPEAPYDARLRRARATAASRTGQK